MIRSIAWLGIVVLWLLPAAAHAQVGQNGQIQPRTVSVDGVPRSYILFVPPGVTRPAPLVLVFHGGGGRPEGMIRSVGMNDIAYRQHFIVAYPAGAGRAGGPGGTWNIGGPMSASSADDIGFVQAILRDIERIAPVDRRRIYATGESMGGVFTYRLACEMSGVFAAIAPVAATMAEPNCQPHDPVAVLHIHGTADEVIPFNGGRGRLTGSRSWPPPGRGVEFWSQFDSCSRAESNAADGPDTTCHTYGSCRATVEYCVVNGGGHAWPGTQPLRWQERLHVNVSQTFPASQRIWEFFAAHPKPQ